MDDRAEFLAGQRPDDVAIFLDAAHVDDVEKLAKYGAETDDGILIITEAERGRSAFQAATGVDPMNFAQGAMQTDGDIYRDLTGGDCPEADGDEEHHVRYVFAFAEEKNEDVGGLYAEGAVIHAYAQCDCGQTYSEKWLAE